jgi:hypothetical protein
MRESVAHVARTVVQEALARGSAVAVAAASAAVASTAPSSQQAVLTGGL